MSKSSKKTTVIQGLFEELGMPAASERFRQQLISPQYASMDFEIRLEEILSVQVEENRRKKVRYLLKESRLCDDNVSIERVIFDPQRGLEKKVVDNICEGWWLDNPERPWISITGPSGTGKTFLAKAILKRLIEQGNKGIYFEMNEFLESIDKALSSNRIKQFRQKINRFRILVLDDLQLTNVSEDVRDQFFFILRERYNYSSIIFTSQFNVSDWYEHIGGGSYNARADAIVDRLINASHKIELKGASLREQRKNSITKE